MENPSNIVPDQLIVLEGDAGLVPKASSGDVGKVLGVLNSSGDVGWVPDQEGMAQVQADWDQTDPSQVSYIANKPDLSVYATTSAMNTALAGKQNTISDLDTIRAGAAAGATAAQPSDLPSSDELLPSATSGDSGKVLTVDSNGDAGWQTPATVTVDQHYSASSTNPQSGTAVAEALGSSSTLASGDGISLTESAGTLTVAADVDNVTIGFDSTTHKIKSLQTIPSVDQTYDAASTNAQSGTAVAQAIAGVNAVPASTSADENKVLTVDAQGEPQWQTAQGGGSTYTATAPVIIDDNDDISLRYSDKFKLSSDFISKKASADIDMLTNPMYVTSGCSGLYIYDTDFNSSSSNTANLALLCSRQGMQQYVQCKIAGADTAGATGWTVVVYDTTNHSNYWVSDTEYPFLSTSAGDGIVFDWNTLSNYSGYYYKFTFSSTGLHGTVRNNVQLGIQIIPVPLSATSGNSVAGTTFMDFSTGKNDSKNYLFAVNETIKPFDRLPAELTGVMQYSQSTFDAGTDLVKFDPSQFIHAKYATISPYGLSGDTEGTYGFLGLPVDSRFYTREYVSGANQYKFSIKFPADGGISLYSGQAFRTSRALAADVRVLLYKLTDHTKYVEVTGVQVPSTASTGYNMGVIGQFYGNDGINYGAELQSTTSLVVNGSGWWSIDFTIAENSTVGANTTGYTLDSILYSLSQYAICFYTPNTTGTAPNGCDYSSIQTYIPPKIGQIIPADTVQSVIPAPSAASADKVLTVNASGSAEWKDADVSKAYVQTQIGNAVSTDTDKFNLGGAEPVKVEFTRVEDTSVIVPAPTNLTPGNPSNNQNNIAVIAFDLDAVHKAVDSGYNPILKINTGISNGTLSELGWGFSDSTGYSATISPGRSIPPYVHDYNIPALSIDICNGGTYEYAGDTWSYGGISGARSNTKRYFIVKAVYVRRGSTTVEDIDAWMSNGNITLEGWPTDGYGNKVVIPNIPASTSADSGKVLKVNASGNAEWGTDGFTNTAGVTDIQVVNALPASPVSTVLYLIPET